MDREIKKVKEMFTNHNCLRGFYIINYINFLLSR